MGLTVGTNSYVTQDEALAYCNDRLNCSAFVNASTTVKDQALMTATALLDRQSWAGTKLSPTQALDWPRTGITDQEGQSVPTSILHAVTATIAAGGSGYVANDTIILTGGTFTTPVTMTVLTVSTGAVATAKIKYTGAYTVAPSNPVAQGSTSGGGSNATFNLTLTADVPQFIKDACCELANALISDQSILNSSQGTNTQRLKAGPAEIWYFRPTTGTRFPLIVNELIGPYLTNSAGISSPFVSGTDAVSELDEYELTGGY